MVAGIMAQWRSWGGVVVKVGPRAGVPSGTPDLVGVLLRDGKRRDVWEVDLLNFLVENVGEVDRFRDGWPFGWNIDRRCKK